MAVFPQARHPKSNLLLFLIPLTISSLLLILIVLLHPAAPPPQPTVMPVWLAPHSTTEVRLLPGAGSPVYAFGADAAQPTLLALRAAAPDYRFAAQVRDDAGMIIADFDSQLQVAAFSLAPRNGSYQLRLSSTTQQLGIVYIAVGAAAAAQSNPPAAILSKAAPTCQATPLGETAILVRSAPHTEYEVLTTLAPGGYLPILGRTDDGWYAVNLNERMSWIAGDTVTLVGTCTAIPTLLNPVIPTATADAEVYLLEVDRDGSRMLRDAISTPQGDRNDLIWVRAINLYNFPPNNYREFTLTVNCTGTGAGYLRWGSPYNPTLRCGESFRFPFLYEISQQPIAIVLDADAPQSYVEYMISATSSTSQAYPALLPAPLDAEGAAG